MSDRAKEIRVAMENAIEARVTLEMMRHENNYHEEHWNTREQRRKIEEADKELWALYETPDQTPHALGS